MERKPPSIQPQRRRRRTAPAQRGGTRGAGRSGGVADGGSRSEPELRDRIASYRAELMRREVVLQRKRMEELTANVERQIGRMEKLNGNLVRQREQMETLNGNLDRLIGVAVFAAVIGALVRRVGP